MNMKWIRALLMALPVAALTVGSSIAADSSDMHPFDSAGIVDESPDGQGVVIISDSVLYVTKDTIVRSSSGKSGSTSALSKGTKVGYNSVAQGGMRFVTDAWILPANFNFAEFEGLED